MGQPAARIGDLTAHGGTILVGHPTVLIGGMPAARIGDMHVCPMVTPGLPPIPHVGGPVVLGSPTVLIGGMPAARVGDMLTCVGPPDTIALGCFTVLIGEAGGGAGGPAGGGGGAAAAAQASAANAQTANAESSTKIEHYLEFRFVDKIGNYVSGIPYKLSDTNNKESKSVLLANGMIRRDAIKQGQGKVQLFYVYNAKWSKEKVKVGETVKLQADVEGIEDGTEAVFQIYKRDISDPDFVIENIYAEVKSNKVETEWKYELPEKTGEPKQSDERTKKYTSPVFFFEVIIEHSKSRSGILDIKDDIEIELKDVNGEPIADEEYILYLQNGEIRKGKLDSNGYKKEENIPPGECDIKFPNLAEDEEDSQTDMQQTEENRFIKLILKTHDTNEVIPNKNYTLITEEGERHGQTDDNGLLLEENLPQGLLKIKLDDGDIIYFGEESQQEESDSDDFVENDQFFDGGGIDRNEYENYKNRFIDYDEPQEE